MTPTDIHIARWGSGPEVIMAHGGPQGSPWAVNTASPPSVRWQSRRGR